MHPISRPTGLPTAAAVLGVLLSWIVGSSAAAPPSGVQEYTGLAEASAGVILDDRHFVVAEDECNVLRLYRLGESGPVGHPIDLRSFLGAGERASDLDGAARIGDVVYWICSHSRTSCKGHYREERHRLFATRVTATAGGPPSLTPVGSAYRRLVEEMRRAPALKDLKLDAAAKRKPEDKDGLNIEGLAAAADGGLLVGFRNPIRNGKAAVVAIKNPSEVINGGRPSFGQPMLLDLESRGIRDLVRLGDGFAILAGPVADAGTFALFTWSGDSGQAPIRKQLLPQGLFPEGVLSLGGGKLLLLSDDGAPAGTAACGSPAKLSQRFRTLRVVLN